MGEPGPFKIVLSELEGASAATLGDPNADRVKAELARLFNLDVGMASSILSAVPIVVLDGMNAYQAGVVRQRLQGLVHLGCKVITTDEESDTIPRVNWPETPSVASVSDPAPSPHSTQEHSPGTLSCPSCQATFQLVPLNGRQSVHTARSLDALAETQAPPEEAPAPRKAPETRAATRIPDPEDEDDWMNPPVSRVTPPLSSAPHAFVPEPDPINDIFSQPDAAPAPSSARFDEAALLAYHRAETAPPPEPEPIAATPRHTFDRASFRAATEAPPQALEVKFSESSESLQLDATRDSGVVQIDPFAGSASQDPFDTSQDLFGGSSVQSAPISNVPVDPFESSLARKGATTSDAAADLFADPFDEAGSEERVGGFVPAAPADGSSVFEATGSLHDSGSDILDLDPPHRRSTSAERVSTVSATGSRTSGDFEDDFNLLEDPSSDRAPTLESLESLEELDDLEDLRETDQFAEPAGIDGGPSADSFARMLDDAPTGRDSGGRSPSTGRGKKRKKKSRSRSKGKGKGSDELDDLLQMFGPEDEKPLDDMEGLEPAPLDLSPRGANARDPFGTEFPSDILEPLNPTEAMEIIKSQKTRDRSGGGRSPAPRGRSSASSPFEALGSDDSLDLFGDSQPPARSRPGRAKKKSRGVPFSVSDEDLDLFEDSRGARRPSKSGSSKAKPKRNATDPFARARKEMEEERGSRTSEPARGSKRSGASSRRRSSKASGRAKRSSKAPRASGGPAPKGAGDHGLVLSRISDPDKKDKAAELIAEIKGCSIDDAQRLTERTIIPVLKGVSRDVAEFHLDKFRRFKIAGRVTTRQRSS